MSNQPTLFKLGHAKPDPSKTETNCPMCKRLLVISANGVPRHRSGDSAKCIDEMKAQVKAIRAKAAGGKA